MQTILHFYYFTFLMAIDQGTEPIDTIDKPDFRTFHDELWSGATTLVDTAAKRAYAMIHKEAFQLKAKTERFEESLQILELR